MSNRYVYMVAEWNDHGAPDYETVKVFNNAEAAHKYLKHLDRNVAFVDKWKVESEYNGE